MAGAEIPRMRQLWGAAWGVYKERWANLARIAAMVALPAALLNWSSGSETVSAYTAVAGLAMNLALVWAVTQPKLTTVKEAYYAGTAKLVVFCLVVAALSAMLIPLALGLSFYEIGINSLAAVSTFEQLLIGVVGVALALPSLYWLNRYWPAVFELLAPGVTPLGALRQAKARVKGRSWVVLRRQLLFLAAILLLAFPPALVFLFALQASENQIFIYLLQLSISLIYIPFSWLYWHQLWRSLK